MSFPTYIAVDTEFTSDDILQGQVMQIGFVQIGTGQVGQWVLPVSTNADVNMWVREHHTNLLNACLKLRVFSNTHPPILRGTDWVNATLAGQIFQMGEWLETGRRETVKLHAPPGAENNNVWSEDFPLVMVNWSGSYDFAFIAKLFSLVRLPNPFHYRMVDVSLLAMAVFPELPWGFRSADVRRLLGLPQVPEEEKHNALADAKALVEVYCKLNEIADARARASRMLVEAYEQGEKEGGSVRWEHLDAAVSWAKMAEGGGENTP